MKNIFLVFLFCFTFFFKASGSLLVLSDDQPNFVSFIVGRNITKTYENFDDLNTDFGIGINYSIQYEYNLIKKKEKTGKQDVISIDEKTVLNNRIIFRATFVNNDLTFNFKDNVYGKDNLKIKEQNKYFQLLTLFNFKHLVDIFEFENCIIRSNINMLIGPYYNYHFNERNINILDNEKFKTNEFGACLGVGYEFETDMFIFGLEYTYQIAFTPIYFDNNEKYIRNNQHFINFILTPKIYF